MRISQPGILSGLPEIVKVGYFKKAISLHPRRLGLAINMVTVNLGYLTKVHPKFQRLLQINQ